MSFSAFSKDYAENSFTSVENRFITKYLPEADGDAVRVYLYGLYLCGCSDGFDAAQTAKLLGLPEERLAEIFGFWEECGLVQILSKDPLFVEYLPVSYAVGKPKPIRPEKYAQFNRELFRLMQMAGKDLKPYEQQRILEFLENNPMEPQAFLLVVEYYIKKQGGKLTVPHLLNAAAKLVREHKLTYEQVEAEYADFNAHREELERIFRLLGIFRAPQDSDYTFLEGWRNAGVETGAVYACAETLKKGSLSTLDQLVSELTARGIKTEKDAREYLAERQELASVVFKVARKLGVKVQNPRPYIEEYAEKWTERGYDGESLTLLAGLGLKLSYGFAELDGLLDGLYADGVVDHGSVKAYCAAREKQLRLLQSIQGICGVVKKTQAALDMVETWRSWSFSDEMILEAARRSAGASSPLAYMNKLLSEWKRLGAFTPSEIPEREPLGRSAFKNEAVVAADEKSDRERFYSLRRAQAVRRAERAQAAAEKSEPYRLAERERKKWEIELARAEVYSPEQIPLAQKNLEKALRAREEALRALGLSEQDLQPKFACEKCSDTGFLPSGLPCDCYRP